MIKVYKSNSTISINVVLPSKKSYHVAFTPMTNGSSVYKTADEDIQRAIERHYKYGKAFKLVSVIDPVAKAKEEAEAKAKAEAKKAEVKSKKKQVKVTDYDDAKSYLARTFDISRTTLRSRAAIMKEAEVRNIEFIGLEE